MSPYSVGCLCTVVSDVEKRLKTRRSKTILKMKLKLKKKNIGVPMSKMV